MSTSPGPQRSALDNRPGLWLALYLCGAVSTVEWLRLFREIASALHHERRVA